MSFTGSGVGAEGFSSRGEVGKLQEPTGARQAVSMHLKSGHALPGRCWSEPSRISAGLRSPNGGRLRAKSRQRRFRGWFGAGRTRPPTPTATFRLSRDNSVRRPKGTKETKAEKAPGGGLSASPNDHHPVTLMGSAKVRFRPRLALFPWLPSVNQLHRYG